jgi:hypothetical protein
MKRIFDIVNGKVERKSGNMHMLIHNYVVNSIEMHNKIFKLSMDYIIQSSIYNLTNYVYTYMWMCECIFT